MEADLLDLSGDDWSQPTPAQTVIPQAQASSPHSGSDSSQSPSSAPKLGSNQASKWSQILLPNRPPSGATPIITAPEVADEDVEADVWSSNGGLSPIPEFNESAESTHATNTPAPASPPLSIRLSPLAEPFKSARETSNLGASQTSVSPFSSPNSVVRSPLGGHGLLLKAIVDRVDDNTGSRDGPFDRHSPPSVSQRSMPSFHSIPTLVPVRVSNPTAPAQSPVAQEVDKQERNKSTSTSPPPTEDIKDNGPPPTATPIGNSPSTEDASLPSDVQTDEEDSKSPISRLTASLSAISLSQDIDAVEESDQDNMAPRYTTPSGTKSMFSIQVSPTSTTPFASPPCTSVPPPAPDEPEQVRGSEHHSIPSNGIHARSRDPTPSNTSPEVDAAGQPSEEKSTESSSPRALDFASEELDETVAQHMSVQLWNPDQQRLSGLADQWKECCDTFEDFSKGFQDAIEMIRLQTTSGGAPATSDSDKPTLKVLQTHVALLSARVTGLQSDKKDVADRLAASDARCRALGDELSSAHALEETLHRQLQEVQAAKERETKFKSELVKQYLLLKHESMGFKRQYESKKTFALVLFEGHHTLFDPTLIRNGHRGGRETGTCIETALSSLCQLDGLTGTPTAIALHLFLDIPATARTLLESGVIESRREFHDFLDGLSAHSGLFTVVDTEGPEGPADKIRDHIELYSGVTACSTIVLAAKEYEPYRALIDELSGSEHPTKLRAVRSTPDPNDDPFAVLGQDRLVYIGGVFPMDAQAPSRRIEDDGLSRITTPRRALSTASSLLDSPKTARLLARPALISPPTEHRRQSPFPPSPPPEIKPAPWAHREVVRDVSPSPPLETPLPSRPVTKGSLLDHYYGFQSDSSRASSVAGSDRTASPPTPKAKAIALPAAKPSLHDRIHGTALRVPIDASEGSIGGSPPESDEDEPSVPLPHSALKFVQRPTAFSTSPAPSTASSRDSPYNTRYSPRPTKPAPRFGGKGPSTSGSNDIPLGTPSGKWGAPKDGGDRVHGFKRHPNSHIFQ